MKFRGVPLHVGGPLALVNLGVTVTIAVTGAVPEFVAVNDEIFPIPEAANPIEGVLLAHSNIVPVTVPVKLIAPDALALQSTKLLGAVTVGIGFTVAVTVDVTPGQLTLPDANDGVMVYTIF